MSLLICAISNTVPTSPVLSRVSGYVYERKLIEKYITENGTDPMTGESLTVDQLTDIKVPNVMHPVAPHATSIPALLKSLQDEWDAIMLHAFTQRQQLHSVRQELSHALYQHDAACRVIARLSKEVTSAREALSLLVPHVDVQSKPPTQETTEAAAVASEVPVVDRMMQVDATSKESAAGISDEVLQKLQDKASTLTLERKKKGKIVPENLTPLDTLRAFQMVKSFPALHSAGVPGILALDIHCTNDNKILTGGNDGNATVFDRSVEQIVVILKGHAKKVEKVAFHFDENIVLTGSADGSVKVWNVVRGSAMQTMKMHARAVTGLSLHPTGDYLLTGSLDEHWAFSDIHTGALLTKVVADEKENAKFTSAQFHPDGLIFATGTDNGMVKIWDLKERTNVANFGEHTGPVSAMSFSENGYYLATGAEDNCVRLWDLRKLKNFKTIQLEGTFDVRDLCFDKSGTYLALAGSDIRLFVCKTWLEVAKFEDHNAVTTSVRFGQNAAFVASTSMDRTLKLYGKN